MPFVPTPKPLNVGELFATTRQLYIQIAEEQAAITELTIDTIGGPYEEDARILLDRVERLRLRAMAEVVVTLGKVIGHVREARDRIQTSQPGLQEFDQRLADLERRYRELYRPYFNYLNDQPIVPETKNWSAEQWGDLRRRLEGPILLWSPKECEELWAFPAIPDCNGPDYFEAWSMINQIFQAEELEAELVGSVAGYLDWKLGDYVRDAAAATSELAEMVGEKVREVAKFTRTEILPPLLFGVGAIAGIAAIVWISGRLQVQRRS